MTESDESRYCVLRLTDERVDVSAVARVAAQTLGRPHADLARELRSSRGFVARQAPEAAARRLVADLAALGVEARLLRERALVPLPAVERAKQVIFGPNGLYVGLHAESFAVTWDDVALVLAARLGGEKEEVFQRGRDMAYYYSSATEGGAARGNFAHYFDWSTRKLVVHLVVDFYLRTPWRRVRAEEGGVAFGPSAADGRRSQSAQFERLGRFLAEHRGAVYLTPGAELLARRGTALAWTNLTFPDERTLDDYSLWQVQIAIGSVNHTTGREERR
jgi:hypothetical protein